MALVISASEAWEVFQLYVQTVFLNAEIQKEVYAKTPPGYESLDATTGRANVTKLNNSMNGLHQSPRNLFNNIDDSLRDIGFTSTASDPCVYIFGSDDNLSVLTMYVDDLLLLQGNTTQLKDLSIQLMDLFAMTDMGNVSTVLGMQFTRDRDAKTLIIGQQQYDKSILALFWHGRTQPCVHDGSRCGVIPQATGHDAARFYGIKPYQVITGSLMFLSQCTPYDITYAVNQLARAMNKPSKLHMTQQSIFSAT